MYLAAGAKPHRCGERATHGGQGRASGATQRASNKKANDLLGGIPRGLRLRASLRVALRVNVVPIASGNAWDTGPIAGGICGSSRS